MSCHRTGRALPHILVMILGLLVITVPVVAAPAWYDCNWGYRQSIVIDHTKVAGSQSNFPVLVSLASDPALSSRARADGYDIVFTSGDGTTRLAHQIESYSGSTGALVAWVMVPALSSSNNTVLYMYYGYPGASNQQNAAGVWSNGYRGVWHLGEAGTGPRYDSTGGGNNLKTRNYTGIEGVAGQVNVADSLNGARKFLESTNNIGITGSAPRTVTFWARLTNTSRCGMVGWGANAMDNEFEAAVRANAYFLWGYGYGNDWERIAYPLTGGWNYYAITYDGDTARWYLNGTQIGSGFEEDYSTADSHILVGYETDIGQNSVTYMNGAIDEVRVSGKTRSGSWIQTEYNNQKSPSTFSSLQAEERAGDSTCRIPTPPVAGFIADVTSGKAPLSVTFTDQSTNAPTSWSWEFGDGGTSTLQNPVHAYTAAGTYTVTLTATNGDGSNTLAKQAFINVAFDCGDSYRLVTGAGETAGCVAITNVWSSDEATGARTDTVSATYTVADHYCLTGAELAVSTGIEPVDPQFSQSFDPAACARSHTFAVELPSNFDDVGYLYVSAFGTMQRPTDGVAPADMTVSALDNPVEYFIQG